MNNRRKSMKQKTGSFKRSIQLTNLQLDQLGGKKEKTQITNNRNERKNNTIDLTDIEKKVGENYK